MLAPPTPRSGVSSLYAVLDLRHVVVAGAVEDGGRHHQDRPVDEQRAHQRHRRVEGGVADGLPPARAGLLVAARLHDGGVEVEVVRHHRRAEDADGDVEHLRVGGELGRGDEARQHGAHVGPREDDLEQEAGAHRRDEGDDERLHHPEAAVLEEQDEQDVEAGQQHARAPSGCRTAASSAMAEPMTSARSQAAIAISQITQWKITTGPGVVVAHGLGQVPAGGDPELRGERLKQDRHEVRDHDHAEQRVAEGRAAGDARGPVARVHVAHRHEVARARRTRAPSATTPAR